MIRALAPSLCAVLACGRSGGVPDEQLGALVIEPKASEARIDVEHAAGEPAELGRAIVRPYAAVLAALGPHTISIKTSTVVEEAGKPVSELTDETIVENGEQGAFHAVYNNSADYGRETIWIANKLYQRPRYQRWHGRLAEAPSEPGEIRETYYGALAATWDLVGFAAELTDRGGVQVAGRAGRKIDVKLAPSPRKPPAEPLVQRRWREGRSIEALTGTITLDADSGAPIAIDLSASIGFSRDGRSFVMKLALATATTEIGTPATIAAPAESEVVATPGRLREVDDRDFLLQGIAPPLRKNPDGTAVPPKPDDPPKDPKSAAKPDTKSDQPNGASP